MDKNLLIIKQHAYDTCRYALTNDSRTEASYTKYLDSAKYHPAYADGIFQRAISDTYDKNVKNIVGSFDSYENKGNNFVSSSKNLYTNIKQLQIKYKEQIFALKDSYKTIYPKYHKHRMVINTLVHDQSKNLQKCSNLKFLKKLLFCFSK